MIKKIIGCTTTKRGWVHYKTFTVGDNVKIRYSIIKVFCIDCGREMWEDVCQEAKAKTILEYIISGIPLLCNGCTLKRMQDYGG